MKEEEDLYAPMGDVTFERPDDNTEVNSDEPEILSYKDVDLEYSKKPFNKKKFFTYLTIILILVLVGVAGYFYQSNNKIILKKGTVKAATDIEDIYYGIRKSDYLDFNENSPFKTSLILSFDTSYDETKVSKEEEEFLKVLNDVVLSETLDIDYATKKLKHSFKSTYIGGNILEITGNADKKGVTYKIRDVIGKHISYPTNVTKTLFELPKDDEKQLNSIKKMVFESLFKFIEEKDLNRTKTTLDINGSKVSVIDVSLSLNEGTFKSLLEKTIVDLERNDTFIKKTADYTNYTQTRLKELLEMLRLSISASDFNDNYIFHIYVKGFAHNVVGYEIQIDDLKILNVKNKNDKVVSIKDGNEVIFKYNKGENKNKNPKYDITLGDLKLNIDSTKKDDNIVYTYELRGIEDVYYSGTLSSSSEKNVRNLNGNKRLTINKYNNDDEELSSVVLTLSYNIKLENTISPYDDDDAVEYSKLTADDKEEIKKRIKETEYFELIKSKLDAYIKKSD